MAYKATIELLIDVSTEAEACDAIAETMRENMRKNETTSAFVDWRHHLDPDLGEYGLVEVCDIP